MALLLGVFAIGWRRQVGLGEAKEEALGRAYAVVDTTDPRSSALRGPSGYLRQARGLLHIRPNRERRLDGRCEVLSLVRLVRVEPFTVKVPAGSSVFRRLPSRG